jgi:hypothetical protein
MKTVISCGNNKLGKIPNVSLSPGLTCGNVPCKSQCYALKAWKAYPSAKQAWQANTKEARKNPDGYFSAVRAFLTNKNPRFFRWHVAGDFLSQAYVDEVNAIARDFPDTQFLAFTKQHDLDYTQRALNLEVVFSMWPGWGKEQDARKQGCRIAWMDDGTETRIPSNALHCPGTCDACGMCWQLSSIGRDVTFEKH